MIGISRKYTALALRASAAPIAIAVYDFVPGSLPAGVQFSRSSNGRYIDALGVRQLAPIDAPRFDHDPETLSPLGCLFEASATNHLLWNENLGNSVWTKSAFTVSGETTPAPDGQLVSGWDLGNGYIFQDTSTTSGLAHTSSVWIKANQACTLGFRVLASNGSANIPIDVDTNWHRFEASGISSGTSSRFLIDGRSVYNFGASGLRLFVWMPQLEQGTTATSEISTNGNNASRATDLWSLDAHSGTFDVRLRYGDGSQDVLIGETLLPGWTAPLSHRHLNRIEVFEAGSL